MEHSIMQTLATRKPRPRRLRYAAGVALPRDLDGRSVTGRRFKALCKSFADEFFGGSPNEIERGLIRQAVGLQIAIERLQAADLAGQDTDFDQIIRLSSELRRALAALKAGADKAKPTGAAALKEFLAAKAAAAEDEADDETVGAA
jgi:hypothetical protein